jgi:hypothetical protein
MQVCEKKTVHSHDILINHINVSKKNMNSFILPHFTNTYFSIPHNTFQYIFINFQTHEGLIFKLKSFLSLGTIPVFTGLLRDS